jgi:hypothetical protein
MIRTLLIKPVYFILQQEAAQRAELQGAIESRAIIIEQKEREKQEAWATYQQRLISSMPVVVKAPELLIGHDAALLTKPVLITEHDQERLKRELAHAILQKVEL